ncbi:MAG: RNA polymerase sigma factor [Chloroflexota bacterium]
MAIASELVSIPESESTFDQLFQTEYRRLVGIAFRVLRDEEEAEDVAQDVLHSFHQKHDPSAPYAAPWLYQATAHTALNALRGKRRRSRWEAESVVQQERIGSQPDNPEQAALTAERGLEVRRALSRIPEKSAKVLVLRYSGLSYVEVATALGVGVGQIGTLLRRAEQAMRKELGDGTPD